MKEKGPDYQVDIGWLTSQMSHLYDFDIEDLTYNWVVQSRLLDDNCYKYRYFDTVKKIRDCKTFSPFTLFKGNGFEFERFVPPKSKDNVSVRLFESHSQI